jgi:hypothetical protein
MFTRAQLRQTDVITGSWNNLLKPSGENWEYGLGNRHDDHVAPSLSEKVCWRTQATELELVKVRIKNDRQSLKTQ